jgi:6-phosphogluconolactonase
MSEPAPSPAPSNIYILADVAAIARRAATEFVRIAQAAVREKGEFSVALAGGSTPKALYQLLVRDAALRNAVPWDETQIYFGDERHAGPDDPESNFKMASDAMLRDAPLLPGQIWRIKGEYADAERAAREYEDLLRDRFRLAPGEFPRIDLLLLGMGSEGHTLSLFPGTKALHEEKRIVTSNWVGKLFTERITLTARAANAAANVIFQVSGADKALALKAVLEGPREPEQLPAQAIRPVNGSLVWLVDAAAGALLAAGIRE